MLKGFFITGTDTDIGKTFFSSLVMSVCKGQNNIKYFKPIQTGSDSDTETVRQRAQILDVQIVPPIFKFSAPISPNRAAQLENQQIDLEKIRHAIAEYDDQFLVVEGAGGLEVPLNDEERISDLVKTLNLPLIIIASTGLGTINHTLLSYHRAKQLGLNIKGVVLSGVSDPGLRETLEQQGIHVLFEIPQVENIQTNWSKLVADYTSEVEALFIEEDDADALAVSKDKKMVWHPFTQHKYNRNLPLIKKAIDSELFLQDGRVLIDAISSWWVNLHGHANLQIATAISEQAAKLEHTIFAGFTHEPAIQVSENILSLFKGNFMDKVFFSDNGSTAVEVALKMAYQFHKQAGASGRDKFLALSGGYHGDTLGAMSVGPGGGMHEVFKPLMMTVDFLTPDNYRELESLRESKVNEYAACIVEPMIQGAGGMKIYSHNFLKELREICAEKNILFICDEIFTGFFRTGKCFAFEHADIQPDIVCLSKGLTGGFLPLSLTVTNNKIFNAFLDDNLAKAFLHGHSYTANPIACAAANASFELLVSETCQHQIQNIQKWTMGHLEKLRDVKKISNIRQLGTIAAFDLTGMEGYFQGNFAQDFSAKCQQQGVLIRPLGGTIYTVPPYCIRQDQLGKVYAVVEETIEQIN